jgi:hypothetical protein
MGVAPPRASDAGRASAKPREQILLERLRGRRASLLHGTEPADALGQPRELDGERVIAPV